MGFHLAKSFLERGCNVIICGRSQAGVDKALKALSPQDRVLGTACDVSEEKSVRGLVESAVRKFGSVDIFIHNAGTTTIPVKFADAPLDEIQATIQTKIMGAAHSVRAAIPQMMKQPNGGAIYFMEGVGTRGDGQEGTITLGAANNAVVYLLKGLMKDIKIRRSFLAASDLVLYTKVLYNKNFLDGGIFVKKVPVLKTMIEGEPLAEIVPQLQPVDSDIIIVKQYASAFFGTSLAATLTSLGVDTILLTGCSTSGCVRASAVDGMQYGFRVIVPKECVGDRHAGPHEANLFDINSKYGDVVEKKEVMEYLKQL